MKFKVLSIMFIILILTSILIFGLPLVPAESEELNEEIIVLPNSTRELTIEVKKGSDIDYTWEILNNTNENNPRELDFNITGKGEKLPETQGGKRSEGIQKKVEGERYTFIWKNTDTKETVTLNYIIIYEPKPKEETGCYTTAILISVFVMLIIFSAFGFSSKKH